MYHFAIVALLALATVKVVDFLADAVDGFERFKSLLTLVVAVGGLYALDYSLFAGWGVSLREDYMGWMATGFIVAGLTVPWRALFAYLTHDRAEVDETLGGHVHMRKVA